jgi:transketolase
VQEIIDLGDLEAKLRSFGWQVARCHGHDFSQLTQVLNGFAAIKDRPKIMIADTIKGRGVSFMEHPFALKDGNGIYPWHAGAPDDDSFVRGYEEIIRRVNATLQIRGLENLTLEKMEPEESSHQKPVMLLGEPVSQAAEARIKSRVSDEYVAKAYGEALAALVAARKDLVVLDADLASDCKVRGIENTLSGQFIENGIAEQDMVSMAGGLARLGMLPVVNSFSAFLASRANEQIYNNASEKTKIIYALHYAGLIPAGPGKSHQSIRDISLLAALPNMLILQPCNAEETRQVMDYCVNVAPENCAIRLAIGPSPRLTTLPKEYRLTFGQGTVLAAGKDALMFAYGPVMIHEALIAAELLQERGFGLGVINMPWLNRFDLQWLRDIVFPYTTIFVLEDHAPVGGLGDLLLAAMNSANILKDRRFFTFGVEGYPACGTPPQALSYHGLDGKSLAQRAFNISLNKA